MPRTDICQLWVNLESAGPRQHEREPTAFLQFPSTGFLVGLPDEPGTIINGDTRRFVMREADAIGLGLGPQDFARGVALCREDPADGWRCEPIDLVIGDADGEIANPQYEAALMAQQAYEEQLARMQPPRAGFQSPFPRGSRALVFVTEPWRQRETLARTAALARGRVARIVLGAVGELAETPEHAAEERAALQRELMMAQGHFEGIVTSLAFDLGGDAVHGLLTIAAEQRLDVIVLPDDGRVELLAVADELARRGQYTVFTVQHDEQAAIPH